MANCKPLTLPLLLGLLGFATACEPKPAPATSGTLSTQIAQPAPKPMQSGNDEGFHPGSSAPKPAMVAPKPAPPPSVPDPIDLNFKKAE
jgi:hypothetical protein